MRSGKKPFMAVPPDPSLAESDPEVAALIAEENVLEHEKSA